MRIAGGPKVVKPTSEYKIIRLRDHFDNCNPTGQRHRCLMTPHGPWLESTKLRDLIPCIVSHDRFLPLDDDPR